MLHCWGWCGDYQSTVLAVLVVIRITVSWRQRLDRGAWSSFFFSVICILPRSLSSVLFGIVNDPHSTAIQATFLLLTDTVYYCYQYTIVVSPSCKEAKQDV